MSNHENNNRVVRYRWSSVASVLLMLAAGASVLTVAGCGDQTPYTIEERMDRAKEFRIKGDLRAATLELKNVLRDNPESVAGRHLLGLVYIDMEDGGAAEKELLLAQKGGIDQLSVMVPLAQALLLQGEYEKVLNQVSIPTNFPGGIQAALHVVHGDAYRGLGRYPEANESYRTAIRINASEVLGYVGLANTAIAGGNIAEARSYREQAVRVDPGHVKVLTLDGDIASASGDHKTAVAAYKNLLKVRPDSIFIRTVLAWSQVNIGQNKEALANIKTVLDLVPNYPPANHVRAIIAYQNKNYAEAAEFSDKVVAVDSNRLQSLLVNGASNFALGRMEQAYGAVNRYVTAIPNDLAARKLLARIHMKLGRSDEAVATLRGLAVDDDAELMNLLAQASIQKGDLAMGRSFLEKSLEIQPDSATTTAQLGIAQIAGGNVQQGLSELEKSVTLDRQSFEKHVILALEQLRAQQSDKAMATAKKIQELEPKRATGHTIAAMAQAQKGDMKAARSSLEQALKIEPGNPNASHNLVKFAMADGKLAEAQRLLENVLKVHPKDMRSQLLLADLAKHQGKRDEHILLLEKAVESNPEAREPAIFLAQAYLETDDAMKALQVTQKVLPIFPNNPALLEVVGLSEMRAGQPANAIITFTKLTEAAPKDAQSHYLLGSALLEQGNATRAVSVFEAARTLAPKHALARFGVVRSLAQTGQIEAASRELKALRADNPKEIAPGQLFAAQGYIDLAGRNYPAAVQSFEAAFKAEQSSVNAQRLAEAQVLAGKPDQAVGGLTTWVQKNPADRGARFQLASLKLNLGRLDEAAHDYDQILKTDKSNILALNNLAWIQSQKGDSKAAQNTIERAIALQPDVPDVLDTAGGIYLKSGQTRQAVTVLRKAADLAPNQHEIVQHYAEALLADGKKNEASKVLRDLLNGNQNFATRKEAELLLLKAND